MALFLFEGKTARTHDERTFRASVTGAGARSRAVDRGVFIRGNPILPRDRAQHPDVENMPKKTKAKKGSKKKKGK
jgi:hypothetical protein